jgi:hypothetical protein
MRQYRVLFIVLALAVLVGSLLVGGPASVQASETPRRGGVLLAVVGADAPSLDAHQETTFATLYPVARCTARSCRSIPQFANQKLQDVWLSED